MAWTFDIGSSCYDGDLSITLLTQTGVLETGKYYSLGISVSGITQGGLRLESIEGKPVFTVNGDYVVYGKAIQSNLQLSPIMVLGDLFVGCVNNVSVRETPLYRIEDGNGSIIFQQEDNDLVEVSGDISLYTIDWSSIPNGIYKIKFTDNPLVYESGCICLKTEPCSITLSWTNDENAGGFNYSDLNFTQILRVVGKIGQVYGEEIQEDVFRFSDGSKKILYAELDEYEVLIISQMPAYLHRALMRGVKCDHFYIDGVEYIVKQGDYVPAWRKSSKFAPVELRITKKDQSFINQNCS